MILRSKMESESYPANGGVGSAAVPASSSTTTTSASISSKSKVSSNNTDFKSSVGGHSTTNGAADDGISERERENSRGERMKDGGKEKDGRERTRDRERSTGTQRKPQYRQNTSAFQSYRGGRQKGTKAISKNQAGLFKGKRRTSSTTSASGNGSSSKAKGNSNTAATTVNNTVQISGDLVGVGAGDSGSKRIDSWIEVKPPDGAEDPFLGAMSDGGSDESVSPHAGRAALPEKEGKERREREAKEKREREAKEKREREAKEKREREAKERWERKPTAKQKVRMRTDCL